VHVRSGTFTDILDDELRPLTVEFNSRVGAFEKRRM